MSLAAASVVPAQELQYADIAQSVDSPVQSDDRPVLKDQSCDASIHAIRL